MVVIPRIGVIHRFGVFLMIDVILRASGDPCGRFYGAGQAQIAFGWYSLILLNRANKALAPTGIALLLRLTQSLWERVYPRMGQHKHYKTVTFTRPVLPRMTR